MKQIITCLLLCCCIITSRAQTCNIITTVAGNGAGSPSGGTFSGDGSPATAAGINRPTGVAVDNHGNIFIADVENQRIRKVSAAGIITTFAGNGSTSYTGDGGLATAASLNYPYGVAVDSSGNVYVADHLNNCIRKINTLGIISTIAGDGTANFGGDGGPATASQLNHPKSVAVDRSGNVYIADGGNTRIRKIDASGIITTFAGGGGSGSLDGVAATSANFGATLGVATDAAGNVFIADAQNSMVRKVVTTSVLIYTIAGNGFASFSGDNGPATAATVSWPLNITLDIAGNIYIADYTNGRIRKVDASGIISTFAGNGGTGYGGDNGFAASATFRGPAAVAVDSLGNVFVADYNNNRVRKITAYPLPAVAPINGAAYLCTGSVMTLTNDSTGGTWSSNSTAVATIDAATGEVSGVSAGTTIISYTITNTCGSSTDTALLTVNDFPVAATVATSDARVCPGSPATIVFTGTPGANVAYNLQYHNADGTPDVFSDSAVVLDGTGHYSYTFTTGSALYDNTVFDPYGYTYSVTGSSLGACTTAGSATATIMAQTNLVALFMSGTGWGVGVNYPVVYTCQDIAFQFMAQPGTVGIFKVYDRSAGTTTYDTITVSAGVTDPSSGLSVYTGPLFPVTDTISYTLLSSTYNGCDSFNAHVFGLGQSFEIFVPTPKPTITTKYISYPVDPNSYDIINATNNSICYGTDRNLAFELSDAIGYWNATGFYGPPVQPTATYHMNSGSDMTMDIITSAAPYGFPGFLINTGTVTANQAYYFTSVTNDAGCVMNISDSVKILVTPAPVIDISGPSTVCAGNAISLSSDSTGGTWSSDNTSVATVDGTGVVSAVASGSTLISYSFTNSCGTVTDTQTVTVSPLPDAGIITGSTSACIGSTTTLTDMVGGGVWSSSDIAVATVSGGTVFGVASGSAIISYTVTNSCGVSVSDTQMITVNALPSAGVITGSTSVCSFSTISLSNATTGGVWSSSNTSVASVNGNLVTGYSTGSAIISYSITNACGTAVDTQTITVNPLPTVGTITGGRSVCVGAAITLSNPTTGGVWGSSNAAVATVVSGVVRGAGAGNTIISYSVTNGCGTAVDTQTVTVNTMPLAVPITGGRSVCVGAAISLSNVITGGIWSSDNTGIATVSGGTVHGVSTGGVIISYTLVNICGATADTQTVIVNPLPAAGTITGATSVCPGAAITLSNLTTGGTWSSSNTGTATVVGGVVTGAGAGNVIISYSVTNSCGTAVDTQMVTVNPLPVTGTITGNTSVCVGSSITLNNLTTGGTWVTSNVTVASVAGGVVTGVAAGSAIISYSVTNSCGTSADTQMVTVNTLPSAGTITGGTSVCAAGAVITLSNVVTGGTWSSSNTSVASVAGGVVTGSGAGSVIISYSVTNACGTSTDTQMVTVNPLPVAGTITGGTSVCMGAAITLSNLTPGGTWSSSNTATASVVSGVVTGAAVGSVIISYSVTNGCGTAVDTQLVAVNTLASAGTITGSTSVCVGSSITLGNLTTGGTWSSDNTSMATVTGSTVHGVGAGGVIISYTVANGCGTAVDTQMVTVNALPTAGTITGTTAACIGTTITLSNVVTGGTWSSSNTARATVAGGVVTGVTSGNVIISYAVTNGCGTAVDTQMVTVNALPSAGTITGTRQVCAGAMLTLSDLTTGGVWSSSNTAVATVAGGGVRGMGAGTAIISYSVTNVCGTAVDTQMVNVNPLPVAGTITGNTSVCVGSTITLTNLVTGGTWSSSNTARATVSGGVVYGVSTGNVIISYSVTNTCGTAADTQMVAVSTPAVAGTITGSTMVCEGATITLGNLTTGGTWSSSDTAVATVSGGVVSGILAGSAIISYAVTNGCGTAADTQMITVDALPVAGIISGATSVCEGSTITLSNTATGGTWAIDNSAIATLTGGTVNGASTGTAVISYTVTNLCGAAVDTQMITVDALPSAGTITGITTVCAGSSLTLADTAAGGIWSATNGVVTISGSGMLTAIVAGVDTIQYVVANGCGADTITQVITVDTMTALSTISPASATLCGGVAVVLTVTATDTAGITYQWYNGITAIPGADSSSYAAPTPGNYSVLVSNGSCSSTVAPVTIMAPPNATIHITGTHTLYTGSFAAYQWFLNGVAIPGAISSVYTESAPGNYSVVVWDANGCTDTATAYTVAASIGSSNPSEISIGIYPNPAASVINVVAPVAVDIVIYSADGRAVMTLNDARSADISNLADGAYMVMIYDSKHILLKATQIMKVE